MSNPKAKDTAPDSKPKLPTKQSLDDNVTNKWVIWPKERLNDNLNSKTEASIRLIVGSETPLEDYVSSLKGLVLWTAVLSGEQATAIGKLEEVSQSSTEIAIRPKAFLTNTIERSRELRETSLVLRMTELLLLYVTRTREVWWSAGHLISMGKCKWNFDGSNVNMKSDVKIQAHERIYIPLP